MSHGRVRSPCLLLATLFVATALVACKRPFDDSEALRRGSVVVEPFRKELAATLQKAMAEGAVHAVDVCAVDAPAIAARTAPPGVRLGRASSRLRQQTNAPPAWVAPLLAELERERAPGGTPRAVQLPDERVGYVSAITVVPPCLTCHGKTIDPAVKSRLDEKYPGDRATGYELGDFRGVFWAEFSSKLSPAPWA